MLLTATNLASISVSNAIKQIAVILGEGILSSVRVIVYALFDAFASMANTAIDLLDTKIYIPIISDILEAIRVPSISLFDLFSWIAAVSFTIVYKIANGEAPFPDNSNVDTFKSATSWEELVGLFGRSADGAPAEKFNIIPLPQVLKVIHIAKHAAGGFTTFVNNFLVAFEAESPSGQNPFSLPVVIVGGGSGQLPRTLLPAREHGGEHRLQDHI